MGCERRACRSVRADGIRICAVEGGASAEERGGGDRVPAELALCQLGTAAAAIRKIRVDQRASRIHARRGIPRTPLSKRARRALRILGGGKTRAAISPWEGAAFFAAGEHGDGGAGGFRATGIGDRDE